MTLVPSAAPAEQVLEPLDGPEHDAVNRARELVARIDDETAADLAARTEFPDDLWDWVAEHDLHRVGIAEEHGGEPADIVAKMRIAEVLAERVGVLAWVWGISNCFAAPLLAELADEPTRKELLPGLAAGRRRFAFGVTEPGGGSDLFGALDTTLADGRVSGRKRYCTAAASADHLFLLVREAGAPAGGTNGLAFALVRTDAPGLSMSRVPTPSFASSFGTYEVDLDGVAVDHAFTGPAVKAALRTVLVEERLLIPAIVVGAAHGALRRGLAYAARRTAFGTRVDSYQALQHQVADAVMDLETARHYAYAMARRWAAGAPVTIGADVAKSRSVDAAQRVADVAVQLMGGIGFTRWGGVEHVWRDLRAFRLAPITEELVRNRVARSLGMGRD